MADMTDRGEVERGRDEALVQFGHVDVWIDTLAAASAARCST